MDSILIIEDEPDLAETVVYNLEREGFQPRHSLTGKGGLEIAQRQPLALALVDVMLPDISGIEVCRQLRQSERTKNLPVIMLTAKDSEIDRVVGFEVGADDYVTKPFSVRELLLRIRAVLRRQNKTPEREHVELSFGVLAVDTTAHVVKVEQREVKLTALEFRLLKTFLERKGRLQTRETLLSDVWGIQAEVTTRTVDTHVKRLREKLGAAGVYIETLRGVGYRFRANPEVEGET